MTPDRVSDPALTPSRVTDSPVIFLTGSCGDRSRLIFGTFTGLIFLTGLIILTVLGIFLGMFSWRPRGRGTVYIFGPIGFCPIKIRRDHRY